MDIASPTLPTLRDVLGLKRRRFLKRFHRHYTQWGATNCDLIDRDEITVHGSPLSIID
jgi:hypothetical protein